MTEPKKGIKVEIFDDPDDPTISYINGLPVHKLGTDDCKDCLDFKKAAREAGRKLARQKEQEIVNKLFGI